MPRLNVEDSLWSDIRFQKLCVALQDAVLASGAWLQAAKLAQKFWVPSKQPVPIAAFIESGLPKALIDVGWFEVREGGYYFRGSDTHFGWYFEGLAQRSEAGKKSAQRARDNKGRLLPKPNGHQGGPTSTSEVQRALERDPTESNEVQPSSSVSSSVSKDDTDTGTQEDRAWLEQCLEAWRYTLASYGVQKDPAMDTVAILRAIKSKGGHPTYLALLGASDEKPTDRFHPKDHLSIRRVMTRFEQFTNLGDRVYRRLEEASNEA